MVASVGSDEDALMDNANQSADWKTVTRKFKKGNAKTRVKVSNLRINENAMRVFIIKHYDPLTNLDHTATRIVRPGIVWSARKRCRNIFIDGLIPALQHHGINPADYPVCFKRWHKCIYEFLEERLISDDFRYN